MSLSGARDISFINTPPLGRLPIETYVLEYDERVVAQAIAREMSRGGQVFFVHNRVQNIEEVAERLQRIVPRRTRIALAHGQMPERDLETTMLNFLDKKYDILVSTNIIESGLDIPNVNTIIIHSDSLVWLNSINCEEGWEGQNIRLMPISSILKKDGFFPRLPISAWLPLRNSRTLVQVSRLPSGTSR
jgi:transcription-repair coupling factor (superfamily II helicase)